MLVLGKVKPNPAVSIGDITNSTQAPMYMVFSLEELGP